MKLIGRTYLGSPSDVLASARLARCERRARLQWNDASVSPPTPPPNSNYNLRRVAQLAGSYPQADCGTWVCAENVAAADRVWHHLVL